MRHCTRPSSRHRATDADADLTFVIDLLNHELRTPLAVLAGHAELLQEMELEVPEAAQRSMAAIARASSRLVEVAELVTRLGDRGLAAWPDAHRASALA